MTEASLTFRDLTLGYYSHPAVHHLNGSVNVDRLPQWSAPTDRESRRS